jgi:hypothetical protein
MNIVKILSFTSPDAPEGYGIRVLQEESGFYYLYTLVKLEGFLTPFASIEEVALYLEKDISFVREDIVPKNI